MVNRIDVHAVQDCCVGELLGRIVPLLPPSFFQRQQRGRHQRNNREEAAGNSNQNGFQLCRYSLSVPEKELILRTHVLYSDGASNDGNNPGLPKVYQRCFFTTHIRADFARIYTKHQDIIPDR